jgi:hypothetical protein
LDPNGYLEYTGYNCFLDVIYRTPVLMCHYLCGNKKKLELRCMDRIYHCNNVVKPFSYAGTHCIPAEKRSISPELTQEKFR